MKRVLVAGVAIVFAAVMLVGASGCTPGSQATTGNTTKSVAAPAAAKPVVDLIWSRVGKNVGQPQVEFVIRVTNPGNTSADGVATTVEALDKSGTIVGSTDVVMPSIAAGATFDYFGTIGGTAFSSLTGTPDKVEMQAVTSAGSAAPAPLQTSELKLTKTKPGMNFGDTKYSYDFTVKVTNSTDQPITGGVHQQIVLYDSAGKPVGGGEGSSDNVPSSLAPGSSYREQWTGAGAIAPVSSAKYAVWVQ